MKTKDSWKYAVIGFVVICLALPVPIFAQGAPAQVYKQEELDQLLAPIALYPDDLLTLILIASTYPLEVVQAQRWATQNASLKGDALDAALDKQPWDNSVKSLVSFPDVLTMMSEKLDWTQKLGDVFLAQQKDVMDTVQGLRRKAAEAGNLQSTNEQEVTKEGDIIIIQPANPQVVYVPVYNPTVVYGVWWYPAYPPYPVYVYPPRPGFTFTMGVVIGSGWRGGGYYNNWQGGTVNVYPPARPGVQPPAGGRPGTRPPGGGERAEQWKHNPEHRKGVAYRDVASRDKYSPANRAAADNRMNYRGYDKTGAGAADRTATRQPAQGQDRMAGRTGAAAGGRDNAFGGMDRGGQVNRESARGHQSLSSSQPRASAQPRGGGAPAGRAGGMSRGGGGRGR
jgi:uncharacterized protein DUF3300